jgi:hypothetical protein
MTAEIRLFVWRTLFLVCVVGASHEETVETKRPTEELLPTKDGYYLDALNEASFGTRYVLPCLIMSQDGISADTGAQTAPLLHPSNISLFPSRPTLRPQNTFPYRFLLFNRITLFNGRVTFQIRAPGLSVRQCYINKVQMQCKWRMGRLHEETLLQGLHVYSRKVSFTLFPQRNVINSSSCSWFQTTYKTNQYVMANKINTLASHLMGNKTMQRL